MCSIRTIYHKYHTILYTVQVISQTQTQQLTVNDNTKPVTTDDKAMSKDRMGSPVNV